MSEIEFGTTILMVISAFGITALFWWQYRKLKREHLSEPNGMNGAQEATVVVNDGFHPASITVKVGRPVRLNFTQREPAACREVLIPAFDQRVRLLPNRKVTVELVPEEAGEYELLCEPDVRRGKIIVEQQ